MNETIFYFFYGLANKSALMDQALVFLAEKSIYISVLAVGIFLLFHHELWKAESVTAVLRQKYKEFLAIFASATIAWILAHVVKYFFYFPRPFEVLDGVSALFGKTGSAFPSGH